MARKSTSTPASASQEDNTMPSSQPSSSPQATPSQSQPQPQPRRQQVTEQQLKSRAENGVNVEDYLLPRSLTARLAKSVLPPNTTIQKDALLAMQKAATVFVSYLSSHANEVTLKRTVVPTDVFSAIEELEFGGFRERLEKELDAYTEIKAGKRKKAEPGAAAAAAAAEQKGGEKVDEESGVRDAKRVKRVGEGEPGQTKSDGDVEGEGDEDEPEPEEEEDIEEEEAEDDEDDEEEEEGEEAQEDDINLVEDLDRDSRSQRTMDPDAGADSDSDDQGPGPQLRGDMGMD